jgi:hypothetical protein
MLQMMERSAASAFPPFWGSDLRLPARKTATDATGENHAGLAAALAQVRSPEVQRGDRTTHTNEDIPVWSSSWDALRARLSELQELPHNWDSYGGDPPTALALKRAELLVSDLAKDFGRSLGNAAIPNDIFPNPDGGLELEWSAAEWMLGIEISREGSARYLIKIRKGSNTRYSKGEIPASASAVNHLLLSLR